MQIGRILCILLSLLCSVAGVRAEEKDVLNKAQWIWSHGEQSPENYYLYVRKTFTLNEKPASSQIRVTADSRYKLFINGRFTGRGPARADQRWQYYDTYDVTPFLVEGENVVAVIVHHYGVPTGSSTLGRGGFFLQGDVHLADGRVMELNTDETWRVLPSPTWDRHSPRVSHAAMWVEIYDARKEPTGWQYPHYDDSAWQQPTLLGKHPVFPWENLVPRDIPFLLEKEIFPVAVLDTGIVDHAPASARLDLSQLFGSTEGNVAYLFAYLYSSTAQEVSLCVQGIGKPARGTVWINGASYSPGVQRAPTASRPVMEFPLKMGWNELLVKVGRQDMRWVVDLTMGPADGQSYRPVQWYAEQNESSPPNRAWVAGPYGRAGEDGFFVGEVEQMILGRMAGSRVSVPGKRIDLDFSKRGNPAVLMAMETRHSHPDAGMKDAAKLLRNGDGPATISPNHSGADVYATIDFGKEVSGYVRLRLNGVSGGIVDIGYSEALLNGHVDTIRGEFPWSFADRYIMRDGPQEWELFFWKGFRYLQLSFRQLPRPVEMESVSLLFTSYPVQYRGSFESSDPLLNKIWEVGRWTLQLCMHDGYEDTPWREQSQWVGDAQVELLANYMTFGDVALGTKYLRQIAQAQGQEGALPATYPAGVAVYPTRQPMLLRETIPTFMAQWVSTLLDHYRYTADLALVSELYPNVARVMSYFDKYLDSHGLLADMPGFVFLDWTPGLLLSPQGKQGELTGLNSLYYRALLDAAELGSRVGDSRRQAEWSRKAERVKQSINKRLWSEAKGVYVPGRIGNHLSEKLAMHDSILAAYAGVASTEQIDRSFTTMMRTSSPDLVQIATPYFYFFYLQALRSAERHQEALDALRQAYGKMLKKGATTWWEHFDGSASLSHAWSSAPNFDLQVYVLGVQATEPGFAAFRVKPQTSDLQWAKGIVPTVRGDIEVEWHRDAGTFDLYVNVPMEAQVELNVPAVSLETTTLKGKGQSGRRELHKGRASYWVTGPGVFQVESHSSVGAHFP